MNDVWREGPSEISNRSGSECSGAVERWSQIDGALHVPDGVVQVAPSLVYLRQSNARGDILGVGAQHPAKLLGCLLIVSSHQQCLSEQAIAFHVSGIMTQDMSRDVNRLVRLTGTNE